MKSARAFLLCLGLIATGAGVSAAEPAADPLAPLAEQYVRIVLAVGQHDSAYVDAYYGPPEWKKQAEEKKQPLDEIDKAAADVIEKVKAAEVRADGDPLLPLRREYLMRQLQALRTRVRMLSGEKFIFDEEARALYDGVPPEYPDSHFQAVLDELEKLLPGKGSLIERYDAFRQQFVIPKDRVAKVFDLAIAEGRRRTLEHVELPKEESFTVEYVTGKSWGGYNWYQGNYRSLIQVNTDLPISIDRAIDLACHEGYPGHHVYNVLLEKNLVRDRGWIEMTVYPLFSPQSLIAEGSANYGIEVAFPGDQRVAFDRDVLFPAAGLDASRAAKYYQVQKLAERLSFAGNEAARRYLNGEIDRTAAAEWLTRFALMSPKQAEKRVRFMDDYRSYVINYNLGKEMVKQFIERRGGTADQPAKRWEEFLSLLGSPRLPAGLR